MAKKNVSGKKSNSYMKYDMASALKNIRMKDGEQCPFKYNPPKFEKKPEDGNKDLKDNKKGKKFFSKFKKKNKDEAPAKEVAEATE